MDGLNEVQQTTLKDKADAWAMMIEKNWIP
jgi:hypothetical protein